MFVLVFSRAAEFILSTCLEPHLVRFANVRLSGLLQGGTLETHVRGDVVFDER